MVSIIVPTLNEEVAIGDTLKALFALEGEKEVIVCDGGSTDRTVDIAFELGAKVIGAERGRGTQMHAGVGAASGDVLWFVHADTLPPPHGLHEIVSALSDGRVAGGNFGLLFDGNTRAARQATFIYPLLRAVNCCYGDSGIFVRRDVYVATGGFQQLRIFEDLDLLRRIRKRGKFVHLKCRIVTSSRRFEHRNFWGMCAHWLSMQILYWCGVNPNWLARHYGDIRRRNPAK